LLHAPRAGPRGGPPQATGLLCQSACLCLIDKGDYCTSMKAVCMISIASVPTSRRAPHFQRALAHAFPCPSGRLGRYKGTQQQGLLHFRAALRATAGAARGAARKKTAQSDAAAKHRGSSACDLVGWYARRSRGMLEGNNGQHIDEPARVVMPTSSAPRAQWGRGRYSGDFPYSCLGTFQLKTGRKRAKKDGRAKSAAKKAPRWIFFRAPRERPRTVMGSVVVLSSS